MRGAALIDTELAAAFAAIREELEVPAAFPADVLAAAEQAAHAVVLPEQDLTALAFLTIDPPGSMDLDQAMFLERDGDGHRVRYAIADVPAFVALGGSIDAEARRRGTTIYAPDMRTPLHPPVLSEDAASLLPGEVRPAFVWDLTLDGAGNVTRATVGRARVRSTQRLDYEHAGDVPFLAEIGKRRIALEQARGGAELQMPEQEVERADGGYALRFRPQLDSEDHNAQISLMTGMAAAKLMLDAGVGVLRTMPPPEERALRRLGRQAQALGIAWPEGMAYGAFLHSLDRGRPADLALVHASRSLFRGAGYSVLPAEQIMHASIAAPYAHVTAPLRRLVDRFGLLVCAALCAGQEVAGEVRAALGELPELMREADRRAGSVERACTDAVEAAVLAPRVGEAFDAVAVDDNAVQLLDPAVLAPVEGRLEPGKALRVTLAEADVRRRVVRFVAS